MVLLTGVTIAGGFINRGAHSQFLLEKLPSETPIPMNETFDETMTEEIIELPACEWYALQFGAFDNETSAQEASKVYQRRGAAGYLWYDQRYRVLGAVYSDRDDARAVREQIKDQHSVDSYLYTISFPTVSMRIKGMRGQLEILQAAFMHAHDAVFRLQELSFQMDRQELSVQESMQRLLADCEQFDVIRLRIRQRFSAPIHPTIQALLAYLEEYRRFVNSFSVDQNTVIAGMNIKYQTFMQLDYLRKIYDTLELT